MKFLSFLNLLLFFSIVVTAQDRGQQSADELLAAQYMQQGNYEQALVLYEELFENNQGPVIYNNYLKCLLELEEFRTAERVVGVQLRNNPRNIRFQVDLGYIYYRAGDNRKMRRQMDGLIKNLSGHPSSVTDLANAFLFRNFYDYALQTYEKGRKTLKDSYPFNLPMAEIYQKKGNYSAMMEEYIDLVAVDETYIEEVQALLQDALNNDPELKKSDALRQLLLMRAQQNSGQTIYSELLLWLSIQQRDFPMALRQARAIDRRLRQDGELVLEIAKLSASNLDFETSKRSYEYIIDKGDLNPFFLEARTGLLNVNYQEAIAGYEINIAQLRGVENEYHLLIDELGIRPQTVSLVRNLANLKAFYLSKPEQAIKLLNDIITLPNVSNRIKAECRVELADILLLQGDLWDAHLLYAQVDKIFRDDPLAHEARFKNARLSFYMGEFSWAKAQLDVLKAGTSRLIANDAMALSLLIQDNLDSDNTSVPLEMFARSQKHAFMNNYDLAISVLDSIAKDFPTHQINDNILMEKAIIYSKIGKYNQTDSLLKRVTEHYVSGLFASQALFKRAQLHEEVFNDFDQAMKLYQQLIVDFPGSIYTVTARNRFRSLRGDIVN